jgi:hypothetical protein
VETTHGWLTFCAIPGKVCRRHGRTGKTARNRTRWQSLWTGGKSLKQQDIFEALQLGVMKCGIRFSIGQLKMSGCTLWNSNLETDCIENTASNRSSSVACIGQLVMALAVLCLHSYYLAKALSLPQQFLLWENIPKYIIFCYNFIIYWLILKM